MKTLVNYTNKTIKPFVAVLMVFTLTTASLSSFAQDNNTPDVTSVSLERVSSTSAVINWKTDEPVTSLVSYNQKDITARLAPAQTKLTSQYSLEHSVALSSLTPNTNYKFTLGGNAEDGNNLSSQEYSFKTLAMEAQAGYPLITLYRVDNLTTSAANIYVSTDAAALMRVTYKKQSGGRDYMVQTGNSVTEHSVPLSQLDSNTLYNVTLEATNAQNKTSSVNSLFFTTAQDATSVNRS